MGDLLFQIKTLLEFWRVLSMGSVDGKGEELLLSKSLKTFERRLADLTGARYAFGVANGTDALILSLKAIGIRPDDEVIVPAVGFYSAAGAVLWINAKPVFVDVDIRTHNIDVTKIEAAITSRTKAIIPIHLNGRMADMEAIQRIAAERSLAVIADAAHAIGARCRGEPIGKFGDLVCLSLNPTKTLGTYGDGGAILTNDSSLAERISRLRIYGAGRWVDMHTDNTVPGVASRLGILESIVLNETLPLLESRIEQQRENYFAYRQALEGIGDLSFPEEHRDYLTNGYRFVALSLKRDQLIRFLVEHKARAYSFYPVPLPRLPVFKPMAPPPGSFPAAERIARESFILPTHYATPAAELEKTIRLVTHFFEEQ